jgi:hypothetical protein
MINKLIRDDKFKKIAVNVKPDSKKRIVLSKATIADDITYHIYVNSSGQIILDPQVSIPAAEAWLFKDKNSLEAVLTGLKESSDGKINKINLDEL